MAQQTDVSRNAAYYKENIGKVKTVDDFLKNDRLYQYAMKAYGLEDMTYAKAFMKKVLQSDLSDPNSYANKLVDKRYREFAAAFSFGGSEAAIAQSANQTDEMIGLYTATVTRQVDAIDEDTTLLQPHDRQRDQRGSASQRRPSSHLCVCGVRHR